MQIDILPTQTSPSVPSRRLFIGGSDARIIMGSDEAALLRLWQEKRGEVEPADLSSNLVVRLGVATEALKRRWFEANTGEALKDMQRWVRHPVLFWMAATLDGVVESTEAVFEAKFMLPWAFSEEGAAEKHMAQLQHNMWVVRSRSSVLSIIQAGASGSRSRSTPTRSINTFCSPPRRSSGAASRPASPLASSAWSRPGLASKRCGRST